jgi:tape measure domain-containing protein
MPDFAVRTTFTAFDKMSPAFKKMGKNGNNAFKDIAKGILAASGVSIGLQGIKNGIIGIVNEARKMEDAKAAFTPLLGSAEKATELIKRLNKEAATTPYQFENISSVAKQLLPVMNGDINKVAETFRMLGDTAGGNAQKLDTITRGFTKAMLKGKVDLESLNMISEAGVPIFDQLSKKLGISTAQMFKMVSAGKITTDQLTDTFKTMTSEGGVFYNGMIIASQTTSGIFSTLSDTIKQTAASIGEKLLPYIKQAALYIIDIAGRVNTWVSENGKLIDTIINIVKWAFKLAVTLAPYVGIILAIVAAYKIWVAVQTALSIVTMLGLGPIIWILMAIIGVVILVVKNWDWLKEKFIAGAQAIWGVLKTVGKALMTYMLLPVNLLTTGIIKLLEFASKIPGVGDKFKAAADTIKKYQADANAAVGSTNPFAPNQSQVQSNNVKLQGEININGAPAGSTGKIKSKEAPGIKMNMVGAQ